MARKISERKAVRDALETYLISKGWVVTYREGFPVGNQVVVPMVAVHFVDPQRALSLQLGRTQEKLYSRDLQFDCYMDSENKADSIADDVMDFVDEVPIYIVDKMSGLTVGSLISNTESISSYTVPPDLQIEPINRWRAIIRGTYDAHYY
jgi:hypothetical protein